MSERIPDFVTKQTPSGEFLEQWLCAKEAIIVEKSKLDSLTNTLQAICLQLKIPLETPLNDAVAVLGELEKSLGAVQLAAFERGLRAGRASVGQDPDGLPE
jgi:hypothetical protein